MNRHTAKIVNTDQRCVVVYKQIPGREDHALVVATDSLPLRLESALISLVESNEGQQELELSRLLGRRLLPETGTTVLQTLHEHGLLHRVHIDNIVMMPVPNMPFPLRQVIENTGGVVPTADPALADASAALVAQKERERQEVAAREAQAKFNPYAETTARDVNENQKAIAQGLIIEAEMLEADAQRKREQAYMHNPGLRPAAVEAVTTWTLPPQTDAIVTPLKEEAPAKRTRAPAKKKA